ncbi:hypothetical protein V8F33_008864 [Rhypophila sp. PSN 637]
MLFPPPAPFLSFHLYSISFLHLIRICSSLAAFAGEPFVISSSHTQGIAIKRVTRKRFNMKAWHATRCLAIMASLTARGVTGQENDPDHGVVFIYPTADQIYNLMDTVNVTYTSAFPTPNLYTFCDGGDRQVSLQRAPSYNSTVPIVLNFTSATPCWFNLRPGTEPGFGANSKSFTIIGQERRSGSRVFGPDVTPTSTTPDSSDTAQANTGSGSLSRGASAGIGVGAAVGALVLAGGLFFWWRRKRSRRLSRPNIVNGCGDGGEMGQERSDDKNSASNSYMPSDSGHNPALELDAENGPAELASSTAATGITDYKPPRQEMAA